MDDEEDYTEFGDADHDELDTQKAEDILDEADVEQGLEQLLECRLEASQLSYIWIFER